MSPRGAMTAQASGSAASIEGSRAGAAGLYVHVPFCSRVCPYCDFAVQTGGAKKRSTYVDSLIEEVRVRGSWREASPWAGGAPFDSVYLGGGTPSSLSIEALETVLATLSGTFSLAADPDVTLEVNPEDATGANLEAWRSLGVTRVSLGVQSFDDDALDLLGRVHTAAQASVAVEAALGSGLDIVSLDLIYGVPGQSPAGWRSTLERAVDLQPHHISCYELTVHEGTPFFDARRRGELVETSGDAKAELFFATHRFLAGAGYPAYEVSNFARRPEYRSRHNRKYWDHSPYLGLGPSAHSFDGVGERWWNERRLDRWVAAVSGGRAPVAGRETLTAEQLALEELALGFRTTSGVDLAAAERRFGVGLRDANVDAVARLRERGLLAGDTATGRLVPTLEGLAVADTLAASFQIVGANS